MAPGWLLRSVCSREHAVTSFSLFSCFAHSCDQVEPESGFFRVPGTRTNLAPVSSWHPHEPGTRKGCHYISLVTSSLMGYYG